MAKAAILLFRESEITKNPRRVKKQTIANCHPPNKRKTD
jgi:hypothetical protein